MRWALSTGLVLLFCGVAAAQDYASLGDAIVEAAGEDDVAALERLARRTDLDVWIAADEVMSRGAFPAARAWARAAGAAETAALVRYVERTQEIGYDHAARNAVAEARRDRVHARAEAVRKRLLDIPEEPSTVEGVRLLIQRSNARVAYDPPALVHRDRDRAIDAALRMGWRSGASETCRVGAIKSNRRREHARTEVLLRRRVRIERARDRAASLVDALLRLHGHLDRYGTQAQSPSALDQAHEVAGASGNVRLRARVIVAKARQSFQAGDEPGAKALLDAALAIATTPADQGYVHDSIGLWYEEFGRYDEALAHWLKAEKLAQGDALRSTLFDLGWEYGRRGGHAASERAFERLLEVSRAADDPWYLQTALHNLADLSRTLERPRQAEERAQAALALAERLLDTGRVARAWRQIALLRSSAGELEAAFEAQEREVALRIQSGARLSLGYALRNLGHLHRKTKQYETARSAYARSLTLARECESRSLEADVLTALATLAIKRGAYAEARSRATEALAIYEEEDLPVMAVHSLWQLTDLARREERWADALRWGLDAIGRVAAFTGGLSDEAMARIRQYYTGIFGIPAYAAWRIGDHRSLLHIVERGRALGLLLMMGGQERLNQAALPEALQRERVAVRAAEIEAFQRYQRARRGVHRATIRRARRAWEAARDRRRSVETRIEREARLVADLTNPKVDDLETIHARVRPGEAFLSYVFSGLNFAVQILEHGKPPRLVELEGKRVALKPMIALDWFERTRDLDSAIAYFRTQLIDPLGLDPKVKRLIISHEEELLELPFGMLVPELEVVYVPSGTTWGLMREQLEERGEQILAIGDPAHQLPRLTRLPSAGKEATAVGDIVLVGEEATEPAVLRELRRAKRWRAVHFACHGRMNTEAPLDSDLVLAPAEGTDGLLTAGELTRVRFRADLVTLSACETGRGKTYLTEGLFGITRSVILAGAPRVIVSLWKVDDEATRALMTKFYELWKGGASAAAALRDAKAFVRAQERWRHPYYWAAWVLWGLAD